MPLELSRGYMDCTSLEMPKGVHEAQASDTLLMVAEGRMAEWDKSGSSLEELLDPPKRSKFPGFESQADILQCLGT